MTDKSAFAGLMAECDKRFDERRAESAERRERRTSELLELFGMAAEVSGWRHE